MVMRLRRRLSRLRDYLFTLGQRGGRLIGRGLALASGLFRPDHPKVTEERLKLGANGCQTAALTLAVAVFVTPQLNAAFVVTPAWIISSGIGVMLLIVAAHALLGYIPNPQTPQKEDRP